MRKSRINRWLAGAGMIGLGTGVWLGSGGLWTPLAAQSAAQPVMRVMSVISEAGETAEVIVPSASVHREDQQAYVWTMAAGRPTRLAVVAQVWRPGYVRLSAVPVGTVIILDDQVD